MGFMGAGSLIIVLVVGLVIGYFVGVGTYNQNLQGYSNSQSAQITSPITQPPTQSIYGGAMSISASGNGGSATLLTSSAGTEVNISWSNSEVPNPSSYLEKTCTWTLSGSTLISITGCGA